MKLIPISGIERFSKTQNHQTGEYLRHNGIDRKDNDKGYNTKNSVSCCRVCNFGKNNLSEEEFRKWIDDLRSNCGQAFYQ